MRHQRVPALVVGEDALLFLGHDPALLQPGEDTLHRGLEVDLTDVLLVLARGDDRRLVADVRQVGAGQARGAAGEQRDVDVGAQRLGARVHAEDLLAAGEVRGRDVHLPVEAARSEQRRVEVLQPVGRPHHDHVVAARKAVELDEQLVQRLVVLTVEAHALAGHADRVELVDEHDRRGVLARLLEQLADAGRAEAREHLDERGRARRVEVRPRLGGNGLCDQRLPRSRWPVQEDALGHSRPQPLEALTVAKELDDLDELLLRLVQTGHVRP